MHVIPLKPAESSHFILKPPLKAVFKTSKNKSLIKDVFDKCKQIIYYNVIVTRTICL